MRARAIALVIFVLSGCTTLFDTNLPTDSDEDVVDTGVSDSGDVPDDPIEDGATDGGDVSDTSDTAPDPDTSDVTDTSSDADDAGDAGGTGNACGGIAPLTWTGGAAAPGDPCGPCAGGTLVCNGTDLLRCVGATDENACGGCAALPGAPGDPCGVCGDGVFVCADPETLSCQDAGDPNRCGGCETLDVTPGGYCTVVGTNEPGTTVCDGTDGTACSAGDLNACGGTAGLTYDFAPAQPGEACTGACGTGWLTCADGNTLGCVGTERNACGGCEPLRGEPGTSCGSCGGTWQCDGMSAVTCDGPQLNACGGCDVLDDVPGTRCEDPSLIRVCADTGSVVCVSTVGERNACGGTETLAETVGEACGTCDTGTVRCNGPDATLCDGDDGDDARNDCGGCQSLNAPAASPCGTCGTGTWECAGDDALTCVGDDGDDALNACGGCAILPETVGDACPGCGVDGAWACAGLNRVFCEEPTFNACGGCGPLAFEPGETCGECGAYACNGPDSTTCVPVTDDCTLPVIDAPMNVQATQGISNLWVRVTWDPVDEATEYIVYADGFELGRTSTTMFEDREASAFPPEPLASVTATTDASDGVMVSWTLADELVVDGEHHVYTVRAMNGVATSEPSESAIGYRRGPPVWGYVIRREGEPDVFIEDEAILNWTDFGAPEPTLQGGFAIASDGTDPNIVSLEVVDYSATDGEEVEYTVAAMNMVGSGEPLAAIGRRSATGELLVTWERSDVDAVDALYTALPGEPHAPSWADASIGAAEARYYRARLSMDNVTPVLSEPDRGYREPVPAAWDQGFSVTTGSRFGHRIDMTGDRLIVGAPYTYIDGHFGAGAAYIYEWDGSSYQLALAIENPEPAPDDYFGWSVAIDGDLAAVGAPGDGDESGGRVHVYERVAMDWMSVTVLDSGIGDDMPVASGDFGGGLDVHAANRWIAVGASGVPHPVTGLGTGVAFVYEHQGTSWLDQQTLLWGIPDPLEGDRLGWRVTLTDDSALVADPGYGADVAGAGAVFRFIRGGGSWSASPQLIEPSGSAEMGNFGESIAADGEWLAIAQTGSTERVDLYRYNPGMARYEWHSLFEFEHIATDGFGIGMDLDGDILAIGSIDEPVDAVYPGAVFIYRRNGLDDWPFERALYGPSMFDIEFGAAIGVVDGLMMIGAPNHSGGGRVFDVELP